MKNAILILFLISFLFLAGCSGLPRESREEYCESKGLEYYGEASDAVLCFKSDMDVMSDLIRSDTVSEPKPELPCCPSICEPRECD